MSTHTRHRFGSQTPTGTRRTCAVLWREGYGHVTPTLDRSLDDTGHAFGGYHTPHVHRVDRADLTMFLAPRGARNELARLRNRATVARWHYSPAGWRESDRTGRLYTGPIANNVYDSGPRVTVNWTSADGVRYFHDAVMVDYGPTGFRHSNGVVEVGDVAAYLTEVHRRALLFSSEVRAVGYPFGQPIDASDWARIDTGSVVADGRTIADVAQCGACGRSWDDAVTTASTPTPGARCPFEYDHDKPFGRWYDTSF